MALAATTSGGTQTTTQTPQQVPATAGIIASSVQQGNAVQSGTPISDLTGHGGIPLQSGYLTTVNLAATTAPAQAAPPKHHLNVGLFGASLLLFVVAVVLFWGATRPVKNTADN